MICEAYGVERVEHAIDATGQADYNRTESYFTTYLQRFIDPKIPMFGIPVWNDDPDTTTEEVAATMEKAAAAWEEGNG